MDIKIPIILTASLFLIGGGIIKLGMDRKKELLKLKGLNKHQYRRRTIRSKLKSKIKKNKTVSFKEPKTPSPEIKPLKVMLGGKK